MRKDTKTFLSTVLGIPLVLAGVWGFNAADKASVVVFQREHAATDAPEMPASVEPVQEATATTVPPAVPAPKPKAVPVKIPVQPVAVPPPVVMPVVATAAEPTRVKPAPTPATEKKSRRTRAS